MEQYYFVQNKSLSGRRRRWYHGPILEKDIRHSSFPPTVVNLFQKGGNVDLIQNFYN